MKIENVKNVLVVGAGTMGQQIGLQSAIYGFNITLYDIAPDVLEKARVQIRKYTTGLVSDGLLTQDEADTSLDRISITNDPEKAAAGADLLIESVPEDPELKCRIFAQFNELCSSHTIFTTNTSSLLPSMFVAATCRPSQFAALHFIPVVWDSRVVEIMPHPETSKDTMSLLEAFASQIDQMPIVLKREASGYLSNALLNALNNAAFSLVIDGIASIEDVDRVWMSSTKMHSGPFGLVDIVGLDVAYHVAQYWANVLGNPRIQANANFLKKYTDNGYLGVKSGRGFYTYPDPAYKRPGFVNTDKSK